jgi:hypothetical protein
VSSRIVVADEASALFHGIAQRGELLTHQPESALREHPVAEFAAERPSVSFT